MRESLSKCCHIKGNFIMGTIPIFMNSHKFVCIMLREFECVIFNIHCYICTNFICSTRLDSRVLSCKRIFEYVPTICICENWELHSFLFTCLAICLVFLKSQRQCFMASNKLFPACRKFLHRIQMTIKIAFSVILNFSCSLGFYYFHCLSYMHYNFIHVSYNHMPLFTSIHRQNFNKISPYSS